MLQDQDLLAIQEVRSKVEKAYAAWQTYRTSSQEQIDAIVEAMGAAGRDHARELAELAVEETGYGNVKDKISKNLLNADLLPRTIRSMRTVGPLREIPENKVVEYGVPVGVVAAVLPTTNPTSTAIYKIIISLKAGNAIVLSPHPRAKRCTCRTAEVLYQAARRAGAPENIIQCVDSSSMEATQELMKHRRVSVILATGGSALVRAAYSSGKPAFGVGPGNVPVLIDRGADLPEAVAKVVEGKSFDYGTVCSSEQSLVSYHELKNSILAELRKQKAYLCDEKQRQALEKLLVSADFRINPACVGQSPAKIAQMAGFEVPADTSILAVEIAGVGKQHPLSAEKLSPVLSLLWVQDFAAGLDACEAILRFGGLGHTCVIYSRDDARIREFAVRMPAMRVLVNTPAPQGSTGITTGVLPSMTLGCGAMAGNITSDNVGPLHLINVKRLAYVVRTVEEAFPSQAGASQPLAAQPLARSAGASAAPAVSKQTVISAVERYLAGRGINLQPAENSPSPASAQTVRSSVIPEVSAQVVDRFLSSRKAASNPASDSGGCPSCVAASPPAEAPQPPAPAVRIVDFVAEADVRTAIEQSKKIFIGPKTIVTPAARELADRHDTLVLAQRP